MSRESELSPSLGILGVQLDKAMTKLLQYHCWAFFEQKVGLETCWCCFQLELSWGPTWWLYRAGTVWRHSAKPAVPLHQSLPDPRQLLLRDEDVCFNIWEILVARCWHLICPCMFQVISTSQRFKGTAAAELGWCFMLYPAPWRAASLREGLACRKEGCTWTLKVHQSEKLLLYVQSVSMVIMISRKKKKRN